MTIMMIDTDILIDVANNDAIALERLQQESTQATLAVSSITVMELVVGCRNKTELQTLDRFLQSFQTVPLSAPISELAIDLIQRYFLSHGLLVADALIAATAITEQLPLLSKNQRDYRFIPAIDLLPYP